MRLPLFTLQTMVFPSGILPLRVFEPRYLRMLSLCQEHGFGLCVADPSRENHRYNMYSFATRVKIIDFETLDNGLLGITVEGIEPIEILHVTMDDDGLRFGEVALLSNWQPRILTEREELLAMRLYDVFNDFPEYAAFIPDPHWDDVSWIVQRWLEVLPIDNDQKQTFASQGDCRDAARFIMDLLVD